MSLLPQMDDLLPLQLYGSERNRRHRDAIQSGDMGSVSTMTPLVNGGNLDNFHQQLALPAKPNALRVSQSHSAALAKTNLGDLQGLVTVGAGRPRHAGPVLAPERSKSADHAREDGLSFGPS
jgi:hypothetical protein